MAVRRSHLEGDAGSKASDGGGGRSDGNGDCHEGGAVIASVEDSRGCARRVRQHGATKARGDGRALAGLRAGAEVEAIDTSVEPAAGRVR